MSTRLVDRAAAAVERLESRLTRRRFLARSAVVGSALVAAPTDLLFRPNTAYAALCGCSGKTCDCSASCCDGYTEFCCALWGINACVPGSLAGGWWKVDGSGYCGGGPRYYLDCHRKCGSCSCGAGGICSGACSNTRCGCGNGRCDHRKAGCTHFRYGNCNNGYRCIGPIVCRVVTCTPPWQVEPTCSRTAARTDNFTRTHNRPCLQRSAVHAFAGNWDGNGGDGLGFYSNHNSTWRLRQAPTEGNDNISFAYGPGTGDVPVVGDWNGVGIDGIGVWRPVGGGTWLLRPTAADGSPSLNFDWGGERGVIPVTGDWNGDGVDGIGVYGTDGSWRLRNTASPGGVQIGFSFGGQSKARPVVGDWDGDGRDGIGLFLPSGWWVLRQTASGGAANLEFRFGGAPGDIPVVGDWDDDGVDGIGIYRPSQGLWYLRNTAGSGSPEMIVRYGPVWFVG